MQAHTGRSLLPCSHAAPVNPHACTPYQKIGCKIASRCREKQVTLKVGERLHYQDNIQLMFALGISSAMQ
jgi:hypothetical protein